MHYLSPIRCAFLVLCIACVLRCATHKDEPPPRLPPLDLHLINIEEPWNYPPEELGPDNRSRTAAATIIIFGSSGEYVEHTGYIIEQQNGDLSISAGDGHVVATGKWERRERHVRAVRLRVFRTLPLHRAIADPLCRNPVTEYRIEEARGVRAGEKRFVPATKLVTDDWDVYLKQAETMGSRCGASWLR